MSASGKRMLVLCPYPLDVAAGQRLKFEQYYDDWRRHGWEVVPSPFMDKALWDVAFESGKYGSKARGLIAGYARRFRDLLRIRRFDLVYCFMYVTPLGSSAFERLTRKLARRLLFDVEDNVIASVAPDRRQHPNPVLRFLRGTGKYRYLICKADQVISSSPALNEICLELNERHASAYISSSVDADRFVPANRYSNDRRVTIGWTGTFSSRPFLDSLRPVLQQLAKSRDFQLLVIGNFDYELPGVDLKVVRWSAEREIDDLQQIDIGVYPLPADDWVSGKSGLKAIQYMMMGLPCVATNVGTNPLIIRDGENGLLVRSDEEWLAALTRLIDNAALRKALGEQARRDAVARYSTKAIATQYREVLDRVMGTG
jgi:glycosyltransferase involved in cell wall biosynthesis